MFYLGLVVTSPNEELLQILSAQITLNNQRIIDEHL